mgnify:CR=1 FL=1
MSRQTVINVLANCYPRWSPTMYKFTLGTVAVLAIIVPLGMVAIPFIEFFNGMAAQPKGRSQMTFGRVYGEERLVERAPVEGTVPRGHMPYRFGHLGNKIEDAKLVGEELVNPLPVTIENLQGGRELFEVYCIVCHGPKGNGDGSVVGAERFPAPPSMHTEQALEYKDGTLFHIVTKGTGKMPSYADKLDPRERWMVVHFLRALQRSMAPTPEDLKL